LWACEQEGNRMRILVVEDEKKIAEFIRRGLREEGYSVDTVYDGNRAHFLATTQDYDLIILDLMIPGMDGISLCRRLRDEKIATPILILTVRDSVGDKVLGLDSGANDYLTKPFAFEELLARCRALMRNHTVSAPRKLLVSDLELDLLSHEVRRGGEVVSLTAKEFALLEFLMRNEGKVVTRTMISEHVWDIHFDSMTNVIDVYINRLREKIDRGFKKPLIQTMRGRGYVLKD
jgi:two-component system, OmpR family, copper resistance phosphate regulon response regulator CusR